MATTYDPDAAVEYARQFWNKACSDGFICLDPKEASRCTGKPTGKPFVAVATGASFTVKAGNPPTEDVVTSFGRMDMAARCLDDATHFVSCCIGSPPNAGAAPLAPPGGGYKLRSSPMHPKAPYGVTEAPTLVQVLERDPAVRPLARKSSGTKLPAAVRNGDVIVYHLGGRYTHAALFVKGGQIATHSVARSPESSVIPSDWDYVLAVDAGFQWSIYHLPAPLKKFAVLVGPFPAALTLAFDTTASQTLQTRVDVSSAIQVAAAKQKGAAAADTMAASLIDLKDPTKLAHAGFFDGETFYVGSLAKLFALFAAFELRSRVRRVLDLAIASGVDISKPRFEEPVVKAIEEAWRDPVAKGFARLNTTFPNQFPKLRTIFEYGTFAPGEHVRFRPGGAVPDEVNAVGEDNRPTANMAFREWLDLSIRFSNNFAADLVITALGYPYLNGVLREAGFQSPTDPAVGPLFVSGSYSNHDWVPGTDVGRLGKRGAKHYKERTNFVANALQVARLLALVGLGKAFGGGLAGQQDCKDMLAILTHDSGVHGTANFIWDALERVHAGLPPSSGKIGIGIPLKRPPKRPGVHDCAVVERTDASGNPVRYVMVVLGCYNPADDPFDDLVQALDGWFG